MTLESKPIERKRGDAFIRIAQNVLGTSIAGAVPTPALNLAKSVGIAAADAWMFYDIYKIYYDERLSAQKLRDLLGDAGVIIFTGGVVSYGALKISQSLLSEFLNAIPLLGWAISGVMIGSSSLALGLGWLAYIEAQYRLSLQLSNSGDVKSVSASKKRVEITTHTDNGNQASADSDAQGVTVTETTTEFVADVIEATPDAEGKIMTLHPEGKQGQRVDIEKYVMVRQAILAALDDAGGEITYQDLTDAVESRIGSYFEGSVRWHVTTVKLDLEARNIIERVPDESPQRLRRVNLVD